MIKGGLGSSVRMTVPYLYIEPELLFKEGEADEADKEVLKVINDIWTNYNVNIRLLYVLPDGTDLEKHEPTKGTPLRFVTEKTTESRLLSYIHPDSIVCFFGRKEVLPSNYKVYSKAELINNYHLILSNLYHKDRHLIGSKQRYRKRRD